MRPEINEVLTRQRLADALEPLVGSASMPALLDALAFVASEKADHIRSNWQDEGLAERWDNACAVIMLAEFKVRELLL